MEAKNQVCVKTEEQERKEDPLKMFKQRKASKP